MVKLIKINNKESTNGRIIANFDNLIIEPNSQIALLNSSITVQDRFIEVNDSNKKITTSIKAGSNIDAELTVGIYNINEFCSMLQKTLNSTLKFVDNVNNAQAVADLTSNGFQWKVNVNDENKLYISFNRVERWEINVSGYLNNMTETDSTTNIPHSGNTKYKIFQKSSNTDAWDSFIIGNKFFTNGCGALIYKSAKESNKFLFGLTKNNYKNYTEITPTDIEIGCYTVPGGNDNVILVYPNLDGSQATEDSGITISQSKKLYLILSEGKLTFAHKDTNATDPLINLKQIEWSYDSNNKYIPVMSLYTQPTAPTAADGKVSSFTYYPDPYHYITDIFSKYDEQTDNMIENFDLTSTKVEIDFNGNQSLYGYDVPNLSEDKVKQSWLGKTSLKTFNLPSNLNMYVKNLQLESYDNYTGEREDLLMSLPTLNFKDNRFVYERPQPIFIDINNLDPMNLNQIHVDLKEFDGTYLNTTKEGCDITLLIRDKNEV